MDIHTDFAVVGRTKLWGAVVNKGVKAAGCIILIYGWGSWLVGSHPPAKKANLTIHIMCSSAPLLISSEIGKSLLMVNVLLVIAECQHCLPWEWKLHWGYLFSSWDFWWCSLWVTVAVWLCMSFKARLGFCVTHCISLLLFSIWSSRAKFADWEPDPADADLSRINE